MKDEIYEFYSRGWFMYLFLGFLIIACMAGGCREMNLRMNLPDDHPIEQLCEEIIEEHTGLNIDLTPEDYEGRIQKWDQ